MAPRSIWHPWIQARRTRQTLSLQRKLRCQICPRGRQSPEWNWCIGVSKRYTSGIWATDCHRHFLSNFRPIGSRPSSGSAQMTRCTWQPEWCRTGALRVLCTHPASSLGLAEPYSAALPSFSSEIGLESSRQLVTHSFCKFLSAKSPGLVSTRKYLRTHLTEMALCWNRRRLSRPFWLFSRPRWSIWLPLVQIAKTSPFSANRLRFC